MPWHRSDQGDDRDGDTASVGGESVVLDGDLDSVAEDFLMRCVAERLVEPPDPQEVADGSIAQHWAAHWDTMMQDHDATRLHAATPHPGAKHPDTHPDTTHTASSQHGSNATLPTDPTSASSSCVQHSQQHTTSCEQQTSAQASGGRLGRTIQLSQAPPVFLCPNFISDADCDEVVALTRKRLRSCPPEQWSPDNMSPQRRLAATSRSFAS